jgi:malate synthase
MAQLMDSIKVEGDLKPEYKKILTPEAKDFLLKLHKEFNPRRLELLKKRVERQKELDKGVEPTFLKDTAHIRKDTKWKAPSIPKDLEQRWVEITGPTDKKMVINALNSGADTYMADFEDANAPTWENMIEGQANLIDAIDRTLTFKNPDGKEYKLKDKTATLIVRPRGWHLDEKHVIIDGQPISGSLFDFGLYFFHNAKRLIKKGSGPYFYLAKIENHQEAKLWNDVFAFSEKELGIKHGTIRATVLIETLLAAFEMEEILYELRDYTSGLNAGRWDYIFGIIKSFNKKNFLLPDRGEITMTVPFMRAYTEHLINVCHKRGAHAMGGMAAFIPSRKDPKINEIAMAKVTEDKVRESKDGFDGTWVAHPDLVSIAHDVFKEQLKGKANQLERLRDDVHTNEKQLIKFDVPGGKITEEGFRKNISVAIQYIASWLGGVGAAAINNLMEDAATSEISRSQLWQWLHHNAKLDNGTPLTDKLYLKYADEEVNKIKQAGNKIPHVDQARKILDDLVLAKEFTPFLTLKAYDILIKE